jgi:hypothetical protein
MSTAPYGSEFRPVHPDRLPTLTEVLELGRGEGDDPDVPAPLRDPSPPDPIHDVVDSPSQPRAIEATPGMPVPADALPVLDAQALVMLVLQELAPRVELMFEARVREAVAPALARAADLLIRETRSELGTALSDLVNEAVAKALERHSAP